MIIFLLICYFYPIFKIIIFTCITIIILLIKTHTNFFFLKCATPITSEYKMVNKVANCITRNQCLLKKEYKFFLPKMKKNIKIACLYFITDRKALKKKSLIPYSIHLTPGTCHYNRNFLFEPDIHISFTSSFLFYFFLL